MSETRLKKAIELEIRPPSEGCPGAEDLYRFAAGACATEERGRMDAHCLACPRCMETWRDLRSLIALGTPGDEPAAPAPVLPFAKARGGNPLWLAPRGALAAALLLALAGLGVSLFQLYRFRESTHALSETLAIASLENRKVLPAQTLDLEADSLALRGGTSPEAHAGTSQPLALVLNAPQPLPSGVEVQIRGAQGIPLWSKKFTEAPPAPMALVIPAGILGPGHYQVIATDGLTGKELERFPFALLP
jgi:hypothetical protein